MCLAIPGQVVSLVDDDPSSAVASLGGVTRVVNLDLVRDEGIGPGDWILIHVGFALSKIEEGEAREQLRLLEALGESPSELRENPSEANRPTGEPRP